MFREITTTTIKKTGEKTIKIGTFGKTKQRITYMLCILASRIRLPPMLVFKEVPEGTLEHIEKKIYVVCQSNAWVDISILLGWLNKVWFRTYPFKQSTGTILYYDKVSSHLTDEIVNLVNINKCYYRLIQSWLTSYCQQLDLCINKPFKDLLRAKYREF